ncbi:restriction endonuclease subunit S [Kitasatospora sp. NPDC052896]|uniref:restriction endonuclease subunit S n=1 Tax=Kitasatospora sp. NPDC052896 TaxID=3364061 RepID=UPI0037C59EFE
MSDSSNDQAAEVQEGWIRAPLARFLVPKVESVDVDPQQMYPTVGVLNRGRGLLYRDPVAGSSTSYKKLNRIGSGVLVYSRLKAFEGAITVTPDDLPESYASQEFPTFAFASDVDPEFFRILTTTQSMWDALQGASKGMGGRRERVKPADFLNIVMDIPSLPAQERIVEVIRAVDDQITALGAEADALEKTLDGLIATEFSTADRNAPLGDIAEVQLGKMLSKERAAGPEQAPYVRNADVQWQGLNLTDLKTMTFTEKDRGRFALRAGDILSCEGGDPGRSVILSEDLDGIYYQKAVHRVRATGVNPRFLYVAIKHSYASGAIADLCTVTTIKHLTAEKYRTLRVPLLDDEQQVRAVEVHDAFFAQVAAIRAEASRLSGVRAGLLAGLLDRTI